MSVCLETSTVLANSVGTSSSSSQVSEDSCTTTAATLTCSRPNAILTSNIQSDVQDSSTKSIAKLVVANHPTTSIGVNPVLQKVVNPPLITVLNPSGPLTVVKTLCVTSGVSSAPQFTLVNSTPLNVTNAVGKSPTITVLNSPVTVVKVEKSTDIVLPNSASIPSNNIPPGIVENRGHNVFVKNTCSSESAPPEMPQSHKLLTANNFPQSNVLSNIAPPPAKTANGQRNKLKILSNVVMPGPSQAPGNILLNKPNTNTRYIPRQKLISTNGANNKYLNKPSATNNVIKTNINTVKHVQEKSPQRVLYPTHKSQIKTIPAINNYVPKPPGIKTLSPQNKNVPGQVQRTGTGLRTIPPQRPSKIPNKPNYIGKHAVQAQKLKQPHGKLKNLKMPPNSAYSMPSMNDKQLTFNQALTAEILETLSNKSSPSNTSYPPSKHYEILPNRYDSYSYPDTKPPSIDSSKQIEDKNKSGLDALSLICQAVLLDHNYNATLPPDSPTRTIPPPNQQVQVNGMSSNVMYSPGSGNKRRTLSSSNSLTSPTLTIPNVPVPPNNSNCMISRQDDDAASDISDGSDRKHDTEGEETDTAPEAEAVNNETDHYGDYVTRCICGYLHDDGYMVECDRCKVWQHVQCVVKNRQVPDEYLCEVCDPSKPIDRPKARLLQQQYIRDRQIQNEQKLRKENKVKDLLKISKETLSDTDSSDGEHAAHNNNVVSKGRTLTNRRKSDTHPKQTGNTRQRRDSAKETVQRRPKRKERKLVKRKVKTQTKNHSDDENQDTWASHIPQLRQWIEKYEEAVTNHYSPELRARISSIRVNGAHSDFPIQFDSSVHKCRVFTQPLTELKYLVTTVHLPPNTPVVELRGKYMLSTQHRNSGGSLTTRQHSQRPGPFLFFYRLHKDNTEVCVDTRTYGNSARFIRRSCKPNSEIRHCIEKGVLHLYIVSITSVDKNHELTIKHESHDLAAIGTTQIACACGNPSECAVNKTSTIKKNGDSSEIHRKRRGRRTTSVSLNTVEPESPPVKMKEEILPPPLPSPVPVEPVPPKEEKKEIVEKEVKPEKVEVKMEVEMEEVKVIKEEIKEEVEVKEEVVRPPTPPVEEKPHVETKPKMKEEVVKSPPATPITTRRSSHYKSDKEESKEPPSEPKEKSKSKKLSREERKLEAILRAIEQMEKADQRKQEHQAKQAHRRESEPGPNPKEEDKSEPKLKRRRKGRARTTSTNTSSRRNRLNSTDSYMTSGDETMLSPNDNPPSSRVSMKDLSNNDQNDSKAVGLLLALSNGDNVNKNDKSPQRDMDSNSNSAHSSPETPLSSACLLVQAAVEPLEQGFKFPKTKKGLMNEWLNKVPDPVQSASSISPSSLTPHINTNSDFESNSGFYSPAKNLAALAQAASFCDTNVQPRGSAKKRWLRQAISEDHCDSPSGRPESPPVSEMVAPPKKRRLPRESLTNENSPPTTPTSTVPPINNKLEPERPSQEGCVEIVYSGTDGDSPTQTLESDAILKERAAEMKQEFSKCIVPQQQSQEVCSKGEDRPPPSLGCLMDPRLTREGSIFSNSEHLVGTVEKTLSILGFEERKPEVITPAKRKVKLSITEYRQRKKLHTDKTEETEPEPEHTSTEENTSESFKPIRPRSDSTSSDTSLTSSDDEMVATPEITSKAPAFNSEPTELERQREISSLRLKKAFGLAVDDEPRKPAIDVEAILNCELPPVVKPAIHLSSPNFPIPGSCDVNRAPTPPKAPPSPDPTLSPVTPPTSERHSPVPEEFELEEQHQEAEEVSMAAPTPPPCESEDKLEMDGDDVKPHMFYTPDEDETERVETVYEEAESVSYVPPFNNPVYPNTNYTAYTSTIDDDARYEGRNPSPPPDLDASSSTFSSNQT